MARGWYVNAYRQKGINVKIKIAAVLAALALVVGGVSVADHSSTARHHQSHRISGSTTPNSNCGDDCFWS